MGQISKPKFARLAFTIRGDAPYVSNKFSSEAREIMREKQAAGATAAKGKKREPKDFAACAAASMHLSTDGWPGLPASAIRQAMISACRLVGFKMVLAKLSVFVEQDGFDADDDTPLIKFTRGEPKQCEHATRNETGVADIRARMRWAPGWESVVRVRYDADQFTASDVEALMERVGVQVGLGAGRPDSKKSAGMNWGTFQVVDVKTI
ncbi:MAG: hypothetical protein KKC50_08155 [Candidatus Omnitrophica bacterium]|nr:hypothetical protein [Candidatus Omnitrophota bacterium]MBU1657395.1 hypothetical protein [Candidatus Omnitrophota bacterium]